MGLPAAKRESVSEKKIKKKSSRTKTRVKAAKRAVKKAIKSKTGSKKKATKLSKKQREEIILEHRDHGRRLAWSFLSSWRIRLPQDEVVSVVGTALCEAAIRFDPSREVAFKTFFFYHLRGMLLKEISKMIQDQRVLQHMPGISTETVRAEQVVNSTWNYPLVETNNPERIIERRQVASACWEACSKLDALEQEVLVRFFVHDEPLIDIAKGLGYCRCHISRVKSRALNKLGKLLMDPNGSSAGLKAVKIPSKKKIRKKKVADYTGGRGRRKDKDLPDESETLSLLRENAY